jgi:predicted glycoside hydrolase/deacetylase ChbG (UPF0249 family)
MIIINADDWGRSRIETDTALSCHRKGRITSVSAMVFMVDSRRAADIATDTGIDVGLHLNLSERFTDVSLVGLLQNYHNQIVRFITLNKYTFLLYNPVLRKQFQYIYQAQVEEFIRLYGKPPSHIDGHQHKHLCTNILLNKVIPAGEKVRRNLSFWPGDKVFLNRMYRRLVDQWLARRYQLTDYFFALSHCLQTNGMIRVAELSQSAIVEVMTHPSKTNEYAYLMSDDYLAMLCNLEKGTYSSLCARFAQIWR